MSRLTNAEKLKRYRAALKRRKRVLANTTFLTPRIKLTTGGVPFYSAENGVSLPFYTIQRDPDGVPD
jgi:hypothetical protein